MKISPELLEKYYLGLCSAEEIRAIKEWQKNTDVGDLLPLSGPEKKAKEELMWDQLASVTTEVSKKKRIVFPFRSIGLAAACVALVGLLILFFRTDTQVSSTTNEIVYETVHTKAGQKVSFTLADGTVVSLNSASSLKYPAHFTDSSRTIYLTGEGHFKVAKDPSRPFSIYTDNSRTQVLGTVFNLKAYKDEKTVLTVEEGRVRFGPVKDLNSYDIYTVNQQGLLQLNGVLTKETVDTKDGIPWKQNKLVFVNQPLKEIIPILERWYNTRIEIENPAIAEARYTGKFDNPELTFLLDRMAFVMKFKYSINQQNITIN